jgi:hypothetical protein
MHTRWVMAVGIFTLTGPPMLAQELPEATASVQLQRSAAPALPAGITPLPPAFRPVAVRQPRSVTVRAAADDDTPFLGAIVGAAVGLAAARWFVARGCKENCSEDLLLTGALGILGGGAIGYVLAGGELPDEPPPPRRRWP